jgi:hypothetical protein
VPADDHPDYAAMSAQAFRQKTATAGIAPAAPSFIGQVLKLLFRCPRNNAAADYKRDHCGKKDSQLHRVPHAFLHVARHGVASGLLRNTASIAMRGH